MKIRCKIYHIIILFTLIFIPDFGLSQKNVRLQFWYGNDYTNFIDITDSSNVDEASITQAAVTPDFTHHLSHEERASENNLIRGMGVAE